jgi:4-hydroxybenzoate polyprenyltransferase
MKIVASERAIASPPLVVDLDGTLLKTDLLAESVFALIRKHPWRMFILPFQILRGKAAFKHWVACRVSLDFHTLPWRTELIDRLRAERAGGRWLVLATGSDASLARQAADHLDLFDSVLSSDGTVNLSGACKRDRLIAEFGAAGFDYASSGDRLDLPVMKIARQTIGVEKDSAPEKAWLKALRPSHWLKNLLVFVPLVAAHRFDSVALTLQSLFAFMAFGCCASCGYLFNDLMDLEADRHHPQKRLRPFASGALPLAYGFLAIPALLTIAVALTCIVSPVLTAILLAYFGLSATYTLHVKNVLVLDVLFLAGLYTVRILAGSAATGIWPSHWLLAFSIFLFFSLALVKRYSELVIMRRAVGSQAKARAYELSDGELLAAMGIASGYLAVMVLALYIATDKAQSLYEIRELLWLLCPLLLYWISYIWLTAHRGNMTGDPVVFATKDPTSRILIVLMILTAVVAL